MLTYFWASDPQRSELRDTLVGKKKIFKMKVSVRRKFRCQIGSKDMSLNNFTVKHVFFSIWEHSPDLCINRCTQPCFLLKREFKEYTYYNHTVKHVMKN
jgi:hypothetical protein